MGPVLIDRLQAACRNANAHKLLQFRDPDAVLLKIGTERSRHVLRYVSSDTTFFLRHTTAMNNAASGDF